MEQIKCYCGHTTYCDCGPEKTNRERFLELVSNKETNTIERAKQRIAKRKANSIKYPIIFLSALIIEICSTFYVHYISESNAMGMVVFAFIGPFLGLPFAGYMVESKLWSERIKMAFALAFGYVAGALIVINLIT